MFLLASAFNFLLATLSRNIIHYILSQLTLFDWTIIILILVILLALNLAIIQVTFKALRSVQKLIYDRFIFNLKYLLIAAVSIGILGAAVHMIEDFRESSMETGDGSQDTIRRWFQ